MFFSLSVWIYLEWEDIKNSIMFIGDSSVFNKFSRLSIVFCKRISLVVDSLLDFDEDNIV